MMKWLVLLTLVLVWSCRHRSAEKTPAVGQVRGEIDSRGHQHYLAIPYAHTNKEFRFQVKYLVIYLLPEEEEDPP